MGNSPAAIEAKNIWFFYQDKEILRDLNFTVEEGEIFALVGPSGCGKTTTLRLIAGFEGPGKGTIRVFGKEATSYKNLERCVATVWQNRALFPHLSVGANIEFGLQVRGIPRPERRRLVQPLVKKLGLEKLLGRPVDTLSGGEQQRVALARALMVRPKILLLDEPFTGMDPILKLQFQNELRELSKETQVTYVLVSHILQDVTSLAKRMAVMEEGHIVQIDEPKKVSLYPKSAFIAEFMGGLNVIPGWAFQKEKIGQNVQVETEFGALWGETRENLLPRDPVVYLVHPDDISLDQEGDCKIECIFLGIEWAGNQECYYFRIEKGGILRVAKKFQNTNEGKELTPGDKKILYWHSKKAFVLKR